MKRIRRTRITIRTDEMTFVQKGSVADVALLNEQPIQVCPACGAHILPAPCPPESSAAIEIPAFRAAGLPPVEIAHACDEVDGSDSKQEL